MKKQKKAQKKNWLNRRNIAITAAGLFVAGLVAAQLIFNSVVYRYMKRAAVTEMSNLITEAIRNGSKDAVVDGPSQRVYVPEAKLVLPPSPQGINGLRYRYTPALSDQTPDQAEIIFTTNAHQFRSTSLRGADSMYDLFAKVPSVQACSRQIQIFFDESHGEADGNLKRVVKKPLADGRIASIYLDQECPDDSEQLINYLKQIESY